MDTELTPEQQRVAAIEANMRADGESPIEHVQADYFGFDESHTYVLPDGISYIEHKAFNEGAKRHYLNKVNRRIELNKASGNASIDTAPGDERYELLKLAITGWNLRKGGVVLPFSSARLEDFLKTANPKVVDGIEKDVRLANPWMLNDMTSDDIRKEITDLEELLAKKVEEEEGKVDLSA